MFCFCRTENGTDENMHSNIILAKLYDRNIQSMTILRFHGTTNKKSYLFLCHTLQKKKFKFSYIIMNIGKQPLSNLLSKDIQVVLAKIFFFFFYMPFSFKMLPIMAHYKFLSFVVLSYLCLLTISPTLCFAI